MKVQVFNLKTIHDPRASFYGKAKIERRGNLLTLYSYNTAILKYHQGKSAIFFLTTNPEHFTATTCRHINEFVKQFTRYAPRTRREWIKDAPEINTHNKNTRRAEYHKGKARARYEAQQWQRAASETGQSYAELSEAGAHFEKLARRYGLTREFRENGII